MGRKPIREKAMTAAERQQRKRHRDEMRAERAEQAHKALEEAAVTLARLWDKLNGKKQYREIHDQIRRASDLCTRAYLLLGPVSHLPVSPDEPRRLICGSSDYGQVSNSLAFTLIHEERRCPECERRYHEFYR